MLSINTADPNKYKRQYIGINESKTKTPKRHFASKEEQNYCISKALQATRTRGFSGWLIEAIARHDERRLCQLLSATVRSSATPTGCLAQVSRASWQPFWVDSAASAHYRFERRQPPGSTALGDFGDIRDIRCSRRLWCPDDLQTSPCPLYSSRCWTPMTNSTRYKCSWTAKSSICMNFCYSTYHTYTSYSGCCRWWQGRNQTFDREGGGARKGNKNYF